MFSNCKSYQTLQLAHIKNISKFYKWKAKTTSKTQQLIIISEVEVTVKPHPTATSLQEPLFYVPADSPAIESCLKFFPTATFLQRQRPLKCVLNCHPLDNGQFFQRLTEKSRMVTKRRQLIVASLWIHLKWKKKQHFFCDNPFYTQNMNLRLRVSVM